MATAPQAPQYTKEHWNAACQQAFTQFQTLLGSHKLERPLAVFNLLLNYASQVQTLTEPDPAKIAAAVYEQLKAHLLDRTSVGQQRQLEGRPLLPEDLVIRWTAPPPAVTKWFPKAKASWIDEVAEREKEVEEHANYLKAREAHENARKQCPGVISQFLPSKNGRVDYAAIERVTGTLQRYLDGYEAQHHEDLQAFEADHTFRGWRVNWVDVLAKMQAFADKGYAVEGRTGLASKFSTHVSSERL